MKRVLIIEDHPDTQNLLCDLLELEGFSVSCRSEAHGAIQFARRLKPDLILLDVMLPGLNGLDLLKLLSKDRDIGSVPVLICSGAGEILDANRDQIEQSGAHVLRKPFTLDALLESVHATLDAGRRQVESLT